MRLLIAQRDATPVVRHYTGALLKGLARRGHSCHLLTGGGAALATLTGLAERRWRLPLSARGIRARTRQIIRQQGLDGALVRLSATTLPVVVACLEAEVPVVGLMLTSGLKLAWVPVLARARSVIVLNRNVYDLYAERYPALRPRLCLSHKIIDRELFHPRAAGPPDAYRVSCISRLSHTKGPLALQVAAAARALYREFPGLTLTVAGYGSQLRKLRRHARGINREAGYGLVRVVGGVSRPEELMRASDLVVGTGFTAAEALACHCQVIGLGLQGLYGLVTAEDIDAALAANFGDTGARWPEVTPELIADQIREAYRCRDGDCTWIETVIRRDLDTDDALEDIERLLTTPLPGTGTA